MEKVYDVLLPLNPAEPSSISAESAAASIKTAQEALEKATAALVEKPDDKTLVEAVTTAQATLKAARDLASSLSETWSFRDSKAHGIICTHISDRLALETADRRRNLSIGFIQQTCQNP